MTPEDEHTLIEAAKTDQHAFGTLFDTYYPKIANYVLRRTNDMHATEDIVSVVFFKVWHALPTYEQRGLPFAAWLYRIANNQVNDHFRSKKLLPLSLEALFEETGFELPDIRGSAEQAYIEYEDQLAKHQDFVLVQRIVMHMPIAYQEVLMLRFFEKKALQEIADITGKKLNTVKSILLRGTNKLRKEFDQQKQRQGI
jgi:RNA polymerase sigma-70 factor (ECF subfamily)